MKKYIASILLLLITLASIVYLIPDFNFSFQGETYRFTNFGSLYDFKTPSDLKFKILNVTDTYEYKISSSTSLDDTFTKNQVASSDRDVLEKRLINYIGKDFELRQGFSEDNKTLFTISTHTPLNQLSVLTGSNSEFTISTTQQTGEQTETVTAPTSFKREHFRLAEAVKSDSNGASSYFVRLEVEYYLPKDIIDTISLNKYSTLSVKINGADYSSSFDYNQLNAVPTHLLIQVNNEDEANLVKAFLNTKSLISGYELVDQTYIAISMNNLLIFLGILLSVLVLGILINYFTSRDLSVSKFLLIIANLIITIGLFKLFAIEFNSGAIILISTFTILTIQNSKWTIYILVLSIFSILNIVGALKGFSIDGLGMTLITISALALSASNYVKKINKKYIK